MTFDLTGIAASVIAGIFGLLGIILPVMINARIKDAQAANTLSIAVKNSIGAMQVAAEGAVSALHPTMTIPVRPGVTTELAVGVQYVLDHAGPEAARFSITPASLADKITAQIGLTNVAANLRIAAPPLAAVPGPPLPAPPNS